MADLGSNRDRANEPSEKRPEQRAEPEDLHLVGGAVEAVGGKAETVQQDGQEHEAEHGEKEPEVGERRPVLEQLGAQLRAHDAPHPASSR